MKPERVLEIWEALPFGSTGDTRLLAFAAAIEAETISAVCQLSAEFQKAAFNANNTKEQVYLRYFTEAMLKELK